MSAQNIMPLAKTYVAVGKMAEDTRNKCTETNEQYNSYQQLTNMSGKEKLTYNDGIIMAKSGGRLHVSKQVRQYCQHFESFARSRSLIFN